jgi:type II secretory pathway pseudopilin PulG
MKYYPRQLKAFTLLELMLVLVLAAVITFIGISRYQLYRRDKDVIALQQNVYLLFQATNVYYHLTCKASQPFSVSIQNLQQANLLPNLFQTELATLSNYQVSAKSMGNTAQTQKPIYMLQVSVTLTVPSSTVSWYQQRLNATSSQGQQVIWQKLPSYSVPTVSPGLWIMNTGLRQFKENNTLKNQGDDTCAY